MEKKIEEEKQPMKLSIVPIKDGKLIPSSLDGLWRLATILANSGMVPNDDIKKPERVFVKMAYGMELGLSYLAAIKSISMVNGTPSIYGSGFLGIIQRSNMLEDHREYFELDGKEVTDYNGPEDLNKWPANLTAICIMKRSGIKTPYVGRFSVADAERMKKWNKKTKSGSMSVWQKHPKSMLIWRARHRAADLGFSDITAGIVPLEIAKDYENNIDGDEVQDASYEVDDPKSSDDGMVDENVKKFDDEFNGYELIEKFVGLVAKHSGATEEKIKFDAMSDIKNFKLQYDRWIKKESKKEAQQETARRKPGKKVSSAKKEPAGKDTTTINPPWCTKLTKCRNLNPSACGMCAHFDKDKFNAGVIPTEAETDSDNKKTGKKEQRKNTVTNKKPESMFVKVLSAATKKTLEGLVSENHEAIKALQISNPEVYRKAYDNWKKWYLGKPWPLQKQSKLFTDAPEAQEIFRRLKQFFPNELEKALDEMKMAKGSLSDEAIVAVEKQVIDIIHRGKAGRKK